MKLNLNNKKNESVNVANNAPVNNNVVAPIVVAQDSKPISAEEYVEFEEIKDEVKANKPNAPQTTRKKNVKNEVPGFTVVTYTTKKGGTAGYVMGFKTEQEAKTLADNACKTVGSTWRYNDKGEKVYGLSFGTRYMEVATTLCDALNKGDKAAVSKAIAKTHDIYAAAVEAGKAEREANRKAKKAEEDKAKAKELEAIKKKNGLMSRDEVAAMLNNLLSGGDVPEEIKKLLKAA